MTMPADNEQIQGAVERFWDAKPCGSDTSDEAQYSVEYFREIQTHRYELEPHILDVLSSRSLQGKRVLEIGTGVGTDARTIIGKGALYTGINVDAGSCEATQRALEVFGLSGRVRQASAVDIPFSDGEFDVVYSFGVLHHIADVDRAVGEIRRVLKPGGQLIIMLYNRTSINYQVEIRHLRKWGLRLLGLPGVLSIMQHLGLPAAKLERHLELSRAIGRMTDEEWLSRNTDGPDNPYSKVYDGAEAAELLAGFEGIEQEVRFFDYRHWGPVGRVLPQKIRRALGSRWGWHRIVWAVSPS